MTTQVNGIDVIFEVDEAVRVFANEPAIAIDIETSGLSPWRDLIAVVSLYGDETGALAVLHVKGHVPDNLAKLLSRRDLTLVAHNAVGFDAMFLAVNGVDVFRPTWYDTLVGETVLTVTGRRDISVSLRATLNRRIGADMKKDIDHRTWMREDLDDEQLSYAANDVVHLHAIARAQAEKADEKGMTDALDLEMRVMPVVIRMSLNGFPLNVDKLEEAKRGADERAAQAKVDLAKRFGEEFNPNSHPQVKKALAEVGLVDIRDTKAETLDPIATGDGPYAAITRDILLRRRALKRIGMYDAAWVAKYVQDDGRVHARFWQCGTDTVRFSSSDPNLQQIPRDFRWVFGWESGLDVVSADYSQIEVRVAADLSGDAGLLESLQSEDIHRFVASVAYQLAPEAITDKQRKNAKAIVFTWLFGGGINGMVAYARRDGSDVTHEEMTQLVRRMEGRFEGVTRMRTQAYQLADRRGPISIRLPNGHRRVLVGNKVRGTTILNTAVQGTAAVGLKHALLVAEERGLTEYIGGTIHDEIVASGVPKADGEEYGRELERAMLDGMANVISAPVKVEVKRGDYWE